MSTPGFGRRRLLHQLVGAACVFSVPAAAANEPLVVVVVKASRLNGMSLQDLARLYRGELDSLHGHRILPLNQPPRTNLREQFDQTVLRMNAVEISRYWIDRRIRGQSGAPKTVPARLMPAVVAKLPNSLGYMPISNVTPALKIIRIEGKLPGERGYPLG